jgi:iron complex outermembrane receptor protein
MILTKQVPKIIPNYFYCFFCISLLLFSLTPPSWGQTRREVQLVGQVITEGDEPLAGATVMVKGTFVATSSNSMGEFLLPLEAVMSFPVMLSVAYIGFQTQEIEVQRDSERLIVTLIPDRAATNQVIVAASRVEENILRVPVTVEKVNQSQISQLTHPDLLHNLTQFKGIDSNVSSMLNNSISTRGFNSPSSERLIQLVDYIDIQSPSFSAGTGNSLGLPDLDVASVEVLYGPSSALYGANAFNGVVLTNSRDAFTDQGLDVRIRGGQRDYFDGQLRYAQRIGRRWALKLAGSYLAAHDWVADNYDAQQLSGLVLVNNPAGSGLGYDAVNRYGDIGFTFSQDPNSPAYGGVLGGRTVFMPGWTERELLAGDDQARLLRIIPTLSYLLTSKVKATLQFEHAEGNSTLQSTVHLRAKNFATNQYRLALEGERWFIRAFQTRDFGNDTYNLNYLGGFLQNSLDPNRGQSYAASYFASYAQAYNQAYYVTSGNEGQSQAAAQAAAAPAQLAASSPTFIGLRQGIIQNNTQGQGARINPSSRLQDISVQYNFFLGFADLIVGGAYRAFLLDKSGVVFDSNYGKGGRNYEYGGYTQLTKTLLDDRLKLAAAGRLDRFKNFDQAFSPRASIVYSLGADKQHNFRASYNRAFRAPVQSDQYVNVDLFNAVSLGNVGNGFQGYNTLVSSNLLRIAASLNPQAELMPYTTTVTPLRLEQASSIEVGYKGLLGTNLVADLSLYRNHYRDFVISGQPILGNIDGSRPTLAQLSTAALANFQNPQLPTRILVVSSNLDLLVRTQGVLASLTYTAAKALNLTGNYSLNVLLNSASEVPFYNTPKHKFGLGVYGQFTRQVLYRVNYCWAQAHRYETSFAAGHLTAYQSLDAHVQYALPKLSAILELGGSNILNTTNVQVYGGPQVGQLLYAGLQVSIK